MIRYVVATAITLAALTALLGVPHSSASVRVPEPAVDEPMAAHAGQEKAVLAGGCFWGVQAVFEHVKGVTKVVSGYAGGEANTAAYDIVSTEKTGHAESVEITYDPSQISYGQLLKVYFSVAHDPTELNRQGPDVGPSYRSAIFFSTPDQARIAKAYIEQLEHAKVFPRKIVTQVVALPAFYPAESYHQDFFVKNPNYPYIVINDRPKVENLKSEWPSMYMDYPSVSATARQ
jgi:peptide-methionine (S)-S-oxide reductase